MKKKTKRMRTSLAILLIGAAFFCLTACQDSAETESTKDNAKETEVSAETESMKENAAESEDLTGDEIVGEISENLSAEEEAFADDDALRMTEAAQKPVTMIGDSVMLGAKSVLEETFADCYVDAMESRQVVQADEIVASLEQAGNLAPTVVIALGTNGPFQSTTTGQSLIDRLGSDRQIYWVTAYGAELEWQDDTNAAIQMVADANENVTIIDWAEAAKDHSEWFYNDRIHLNADGQQAYADVILQGIAQE